MNDVEKEVWDNLKDYDLDDPNSTFSFSERLSRENGWDLLYSLRVIEEYKKFIFLCIFSKHSCTPSDEIDQVWHLHLLYTVSYWKEMCGEILNTEIHHGPTKGSFQKNEFEENYLQTIESYKSFFQEEAPIDIWPSIDDRFKFTNFRRVNLHLNWLLKKWKF